MTTLAPIVLFVYNRPDHTRETLRSLAQNTLAKKSELFVFSDAAKNDTAQDAVAEVRHLCNSIPGFDSVHLTMREKNFGLAKSVISGVTDVIEKYGKVIVLEDDLVTTPRFLEYMNNALNHYAPDSKAFSIGGYQFPGHSMQIPKSYSYDTYAAYRCCSWGWATWLDRWKRIDWDMQYMEKFRSSKKQQADFNRGGPEMSLLLFNQEIGIIDSWAIRFCYAHFAHQMHCIYPRKTLVNNIGLDGSGVHSGVDPRRQHNDIDNAWLPEKFCPAALVDKKIVKDFRLLFTPQAQPSAGNILLRAVRYSLRVLKRIVFLVISHRTK